MNISPLLLQRSRSPAVLLEASGHRSQCESLQPLSWSLLSPGCLSLTKAVGFRSELHTAPSVIPEWKSRTQEASGWEIQSQVLEAQTVQWVQQSLQQQRAALSEIGIFYGILEGFFSCVFFFLFAFCLFGASHSLLWCFSAALFKDHLSIKVCGRC